MRPTFKIIPREPDTAAIALGCTLLMCIGFGIINGVLGMITPFWMFGSIGIVILCYITSGVVFIPDQLPQKIQNILSWNPLLQSITWFRSAYYPGLGAHILDRQYLLIFSLVSIGFGPRSRAHSEAFRPERLTVACGGPLPPLPQTGERHGGRVPRGMRRVDSRLDHAAITHRLVK